MGPPFVRLGQRYNREANILGISHFTFCSTGINVVRSYETQIRGYLPLIFQYSYFTYIIIIIIIIIHDIKLYR